MNSRPGPTSDNPFLRHLLSPVFLDSLAPAHRVDLEKSGITETTRREQGFRSVPPSDFERLLGRSVSSAIISMMVVPFPDFDGGWMDHFQVKLFPALVDEQGHTTKYLQPTNSPPRLYLVRQALARVLDPTAPLHLVEGQKKACTAAQLGLAALGFSGIHGWHERGVRTLLPDFEAIPLRGRRVDLVPDGDVSTNPHVEGGAAAFAHALEARGAHVELVVLPVEIRR